MATPDLVLEPAAAASPAPRSRHWYRTPSLVAGAVIIGLVLFGAVFAPLLGRYDPTQQNLYAILAPPSGAHLLGTDQLGRDVWSRLLYGARIDLLVAFLAVLSPFVIGCVLGSIAGYYGGWFDTVVMRLVDVFVAFPFYVLIIALVFVLGPGPRSIFIAITAVSWISYARIIRAEILVAKRQDYVAAARGAGLSDLRVVVRHLLPNVITQAIVFAMSDIVNDILAIVTLGYLGLGIPPPTPDWGSMIYDGQTLITTHPLISTIPGIAVVFVGLGLSLLADGLSHVLRPA
ncbi:MAG: ABC transporter permease [Candidatus Dormiibacterota bacterium]